jgi:hypothetical protein
VSNAYRAVIGGGYYNQVSNGDYQVVSGGRSNRGSANFSTIAGGDANSVTADYSSILGGIQNTIAGSFSTVAGGDSLKLGARSFGMNVPAGGPLAATQLDLSASANLAYFGNMDIWLGNTDSIARSVRFYEGQRGGTGFPSASTNYTALRAGSQSIDITYTLPSTAPVANGNLLLATAGSSSTMSWSSRMVWDNTNNRLGVNTTSPQHVLHSLDSLTTDEMAAVYGNVNASTSNQAIGLWGDASNSNSANTGTIGVLATGNGNTSAGSTNIALQINDGELAMGRTTQTTSGATNVAAATGGTAYSAEGPSGVLEFTLGATGNLQTAAPTASTIQDLGTVTVSNRYAQSGSIVLVSVTGFSDDGTAPNPHDAAFIVNVDNTASGSFDLRIKMIPTATNASNYSTTDKVRVGYMIVNASR